VDALGLMTGRRIWQFFIVVQAVSVERSSSNIFGNGMEIPA
jgi:hypothetical protein